MNKKILNILLLTIALFVWAMIIKNILNPNTQVQTNSNIIDIKPYVVKNSDYNPTWQIENPFLGINQMENVSLGNLSLPTVKNRTIDKPDVRYIAFMSNSKEQIAIVLYNGIEYVVKRGDVIGNIRIIEIEVNSLQLRVNNATFKYNKYD